LHEITFLCVSAAFFSPAIALWQRERVTPEGLAPEGIVAEDLRALGSKAALSYEPCGGFGAGIESW